MSLLKNVGFECEIDDARRQVNDFVNPLIDAGLYSQPPGYSQHHTNHCSCDSCVWGGSLVRPMSDCTCTAELVSDPLEWPNPISESVIVQVTDVLHEMGVTPGSRAGCHIHVEAQSGERVAEIKRWFGWFEHGFADLARQSFPAVRQYGNTWLACTVHPHADLPGPKSLGTRALRGYWFPEERPIPQRLAALAALDAQPVKGPTLSYRRSTWEFRIWNAVTSYWRLYLACEVSSAFMDAARRAGSFPIEHGGPDPDLTLVDFIASDLTDEGFGYLLRHLADARDVDASDRKEGLT